MATPAIGGVVSSETGTVSLTTVPSGGWMLATMISSDGAPATPSEWTSLATDDSEWRIVGKIKAAESSLSVPDSGLISVMWGTGSAAASSWRAGAVGTRGSASVSLTGTTAGSLLVGAEPVQASGIAGQVSYGGAVGFNSRSTAAAGGAYAAVWLSGTAAGGTATATRNFVYVSSLYSWVLVEIPEGSNPAALTATVPGPPSASITGGSTNPGALTTDAPGPASAALTGTASNPGALAPARRSPASRAGRLTPRRSTPVCRGRWSRPSRAPWPDQSSTALCPAHRRRRSRAGRATRAAWTPPCPGSQRPSLARRRTWAPSTQTCPGRRPRTCPACRSTPRPWTRPRPGP